MFFLRCVCVVVLANTVVLGQSKSPESGKPVKKPSTVEAVKPVLPQQVIDWQIAVQQLKADEDRLQVRPPAFVRPIMVQPVQPELRLGGWQVVNTRFQSEKDFGKFIDEQINAVKTRFKLSDAVVRKLRVAGKGVAYRARTKRAEPKKRAPNEPFILVLGNQPPLTDLSGTFRKRLNESKLWNKTLSKVLTKQQMAEWKKLKATDPSIVPPVLPSITVLPNGELK